VKSNYSSQIGTSVNSTLPCIENWPEAICNQDICNETGMKETAVEIKRRCKCERAGRENVVREGTN
jgi:hypothetical protein